jgi:hypothetical protein
MLALVPKTMYKVKVITRFALNGFKIIVLLAQRYENAFVLCPQLGGLFAFCVLFSVYCCTFWGKSLFIAIINLGNNNSIR